MKEYVAALSAHTELPISEKMRKIDSIAGVQPGGRFSRYVLLMKSQGYREARQADSANHYAQLLIDESLLEQDSAYILEGLVQLYSDEIDYSKLNRNAYLLQAAMRLAESEKETARLAVLNHLQATVQSQQGRFDEAQSYYFRAYKLFDSLGDRRQLARVSSAIGTNYAMIGSMEESDRYYLKALELSRQEGDSSRQSMVLMNLGINHRKPVPDSAMRWYEEALDMLGKDQRSFHAIKIKYNIANVYYLTGKLEKADSMFGFIAQESRASGNKEGETMALLGMAGTQAARKHFPEAIALYQTGIAVADSLKQKRLMLSIRNELERVFEESGDVKGALHVSKTLRKLRDSILTVEKQVAVHELEKRFDKELIAQENLRLKQKIGTRNTIGLMLITGLIVLSMLLYQRVKLAREKSLSYQALVEHYRAESVHIRSMMELSKDSSPSLSVMERMNAYCVSSKWFLHSKPRLDEVASALEEEEDVLIQVLKLEGFAQVGLYVNKLRVDEVRRLFVDPATKHLKTEAIAQKAGFGSKQTFYTAFERFTGLKPGYYRNMIGIRDADTPTT